MFNIHMTLPQNYKLNVKLPSTHIFMQQQAENTSIVCRVHSYAKIMIN